MIKYLHWLKSSGAVIGIAAALTLFNGFGWVSVSGFAQDSLRPFSGLLTGWGRSLGLVVRDVGRAGTLNDANQQLQRQNAQLTAEVARLKEVDRENEQLRKQLQFGQKSAVALIGADVIGYQPYGARQILTINRGAVEGLKAGMIATLEGQLIGKVDTLNTHTAQIMLVNDEQFRVLVVDQNSRTPGIVKGQVGGSVVMEKVPQTQSIKNGDLIVTSGSDGDFPAGLVVGTVDSVAQDSQSIFQSAQIRRPFNPLDLRIVMLRSAHE